MLNDILELVRAGFSKQEIMDLLVKEQHTPTPAQEQPQPAPEHVAESAQKPAPPAESAQQPAQDQPQPDFNRFLTLIRGEFDDMKRAMQVQNINTAVQPKTKSIDDLADDALASIIMPKKKG